MIFFFLAQQLLILRCFLLKPTIYYDEMRSFFAGFLYFLEQNFALCFSSPSYFFNKLYYRKITLGYYNFFFSYFQREEKMNDRVLTRSQFFFRAYVNDFALKHHAENWAFFLSKMIFNNFHPFEKIGVDCELLKILSRWSFFKFYISRTYEEFY